MGGCDHNCGSCSGCGKSLSLTEAEIEMLRTLAQIPFLPVARRADSETPVYLEDEKHTKEEYSMILACLEKKGLISLDFDKPLKGFDCSAYAGYPIVGSFALTQRGQELVLILERSGFTEE